MMHRLFRRHQHTPARWVITEHYAGRAARWFRYHPRQVWVWTRDPDRATRFPSAHAARHAACSCEVSWRHPDYRVEPAPERVTNRQ